MLSGPPPAQPWPPGRVPPPPRQGGRALGLVAVPLLLVLGGALVTASSVLDMNERVTLGVQILGGLLLAPGMLGAVFVVPAVVYGWRHQPAHELCWSPLTPGEPATLTFDAQPARYHGIWLCVDVRHPFGGDPRAVVSTIQGQPDGGQPFTCRVATCWGFAGDATGGTHMFVNDRQPRYGDLTPSVVEFDRLVQARPTGRFRAMSLIHRIAKVTPGTRITLSLTVEPPPDASEAHVHGFVAPSR